MQRNWLVGLGIVVAMLPGSMGEPFVRVSPRDPRYFEFSDGRPFIPIGLNLIAPDGAFGGGETNGLRRMEDWLDKLAANRGNFARIWLSNDFWDVEHERSGVYDDVKARRIDRLLAMAKARGIRLKLTLEHFREISEAPRQRWANKLLHHVDRGGTATNATDFFEGAASRERFRGKLGWFAGRYSGDPTIFGWELWNEVNAVRGRGYLEWTAAMLPELHRLFPQHLAMQSLGSFDSDGSRDAYRRLTGMAVNDVAQVHRYLDLGTPYEMCRGPVDVLTADAVRELLDWKPNRPVLLAESGAVEPRHTGPFKLYAKDTAGLILHDVLFAPFFAGAAGPGHCWHWGEYVDRNNLWFHFARFAAVVRDLDPPFERFEPLELPHSFLRVRVLKGRRTVLVWCRDAANTWKTELDEGQAPQTRLGLTLDLSAIVPSGSAIEGQAYDPWKDRWGALEIKRGVLSLPEFSRSVVLRFRGID